MSAAHKNVHHKLRPRAAEESQLLAEEKWIIEAITKIKNQRNCLQIERLHLDSLKSKARSNWSSAASPRVQDEQDPLATPSDADMQQAPPEVMNDTIPTRLDDESNCNKEQLDLNVTNSIFNVNTYTNFNMEDDEEETDEENVEIDMNMLMSGVFQ